MAKISFSGTDELMATLQKANAFDDETQQELLYAAGDIIVEEPSSRTKTEIRISPSRQSAKTSTERAGRPCFLF